MSRGNFNFLNFKVKLLVPDATGEWYFSKPAVPFYDTEKLHRLRIEPTNELTVV